MKTPKRSGRPWTDAELNQMRQEIRGNTPTRVIALKHQRSPEAIYNKASQEGVSLEPHNRSPDMRRQKR